MYTSLIPLFLFSTLSLVCKGQNNMFPTEFHIINEAACTIHNSSSLKRGYDILLYSSSQRICTVSDSGPVYELPYTSSTMICSRTENSFTFCFFRISRSEAGNYTFYNYNYNVTGTIFVMDKPTRPTISLPIQAMEGQNITMNCQTFSNSLPRGQNMTYFWIVNGSQSLPARFESLGPRLSIYDLRRSDSVYGIQCNVNETNGLASDLSEVYRTDVLYKPTVVLNYTLSNLTVEENQTSVTLSCRVTDANPNVGFIYNWTRYGTIYQSGSTIAFSRIQRNASGFYQCTANNGVGTSDSVNVTLDVQYSPDVGCTPKNDVDIEEHNTLYINCSVTSNPPASYLWRGPYGIVSTGDSMILFYVQRNMSGIYSFMATNTITLSGYNAQERRTERNFTVDILYGPGSDVNITWSGSYPLIEDVSKSIPTLVCNATCNPNCTYTWTGPHIGTRSGNELNLGNIIRSKSGSYRCTATNIVLGSTRKAYADLDLAVSYPASVVSLEPNSPKIEINENSNQELQCNTDGHPKPSVTWYRDGQSLTSSSKYTIWNANCLKSGNYTCKAQNTYGGSEKSIILRVKCSPRLYNDVANIVLNITSFAAVTMSVQMIGYPLPIIIWYHYISSSNVSVHNNISVIENTDDLLTSRLSIYLHEEKDFGEYFAVAFGTSVEKRFILKPHRRPNSPSDVTVACLSSGVANVSWISAFNGGYQQTFTVLYRVQNSASAMKASQKYPDLGRDVVHYIIIPELEKKHYEFLVRAENRIGTFLSSASTCSLSDSKTRAEGWDGQFAAGFGSALGIAVVIGTGVVIMILARKGYFSRRKEKEENEPQNDDQKEYANLDLRKVEDHTYQDVTDKTRRLNSTKGTVSQRNEDNHTYYNVTMTEDTKSVSADVSKDKKEGKGKKETPNIEISNIDKRHNGNYADHTYTNIEKKEPGQNRKGIAVLPAVYVNVQKKKIK